MCLSLPKPVITECVTDLNCSGGKIKLINQCFFLPMKAVIYTVYKYLKAQTQLFSVALSKNKINDYEGP